MVAAGEDFCAALTSSLVVDDVLLGEDLFLFHEAWGEGEVGFC